MKPIRLLWRWKRKLTNDCDKSSREKELKTLQGKDLLEEVIAEVFCVTKLTKIVKKTSATTFVFDSRCFCGYYNRI
jgi:hypothetical protein